MKTLFIDFDGTICFDYFWRSLPEYKDVQRVIFQEHPDMVRAWMRGEYTSEDIHDFVSRKTHLPYERLWDVFVHDCKTMRVSVNALELIQELRARYYVVLITGNMDSFTRFTVPALELTEQFDVIVSSFSEGRLKTDNQGESFRTYVQGDIKEAVLIEDSQTSLDCFAELGGRALQTSSEEETIIHLQSLSI